MRNKIFLFAVAVVLAAGPFASPAQCLDTSIGATSVAIGSELGDLVDDGIGLSLAMVGSGSGPLVFEFVLDLSFHNELIFDTNVSYTRLDMGGRYLLISGPSLELYGSAGLSFHALNFADFADEFDGFSFYYGGGVAIPVSKNGAFDLGIKYHDWKANWNDPGQSDLDATTTVIQVVYRFRYL